MTWLPHEKMWQGPPEFSLTMKTLPRGLRVNHGTLFVAIRASSLYNCPFKLSYITRNLLIRVSRVLVRGSI